MNRIELEPVDRVEITLLMDNVTDPLLVDQEAIARMNWPKAILGGLPSAQARVSPTTGVPDALIAEPGFSALVRIEKAGRKRTLLFDTGVSPNGMVENMRRLAVDPAEIEVIVLSHGHWDHVTGIGGAGARPRLDATAGHDPSGVLEPPADQLSRTYGRAPGHQSWSARGDGVHGRGGTPAVVSARRSGAHHR